MADMHSARCKHYYCKDCWRGYVQTAIELGPSCLDLRCPDPGAGRLAGLCLFYLLGRVFCWPESLQPIDCHATLNCKLPTPIRVLLVPCCPPLSTLPFPATLPACPPNLPPPCPACLPPPAISCRVQGCGASLRGGGSGRRPPQPAL